MKTHPLLSVRDIRKTYVYSGFRTKLGLRPPREVEALRGVSVDLRAGEITALLGPNGAGKTTLINVVRDLVRPEGGSVAVDGLDYPAGARAAQSRIGVTTTDERSFFWRLNGRQNLEFYGALYGMPRPLALARADELIRTFGLERDADRVFRTYSTGMKKRLALARCLMSDPSVLLLDEPTSGLDPAGVDDLLELVRSRVAGEERCVLWATHRMDEVVRLCDRVVVLVAGEVRYRGTAAEFKDLARAKTGFSVELRVSAANAERVSRYLHSVGAEVEASGETVRARLASVKDGFGMSPVVQALVERGAGIVRVEPETISLNQVFVKVAGSERGGGGDIA